jgi:hypothetical protein
VVVQVLVVTLVMMESKVEHMVEQFDLLQLDVEVLE